jgi:hypothetical protein
MPFWKIPNRARGLLRRAAHSLIAVFPRVRYEDPPALFRGAPSRATVPLRGILLGAAAAAFVGVPIRRFSGTRTLGVLRRWAVALRGLFRSDFHARSAAGGLPLGDED